MSCLLLYLCDILEKEDAESSRRTKHNLVS